MKGSHVAAFLIGAAAGSIVALLYAPQSGDRTRRQIRNFVDDEMDQARDLVNKTTDNAKRAVQYGMDRVKGSVATARDYVNGEIADIKSELCDCDATKK